jgi:fumarylacetoacetase
MTTPPPPTTHTPNLDHTHNPAARSWVDSANDPASLFPIQNLPLCVFSTDADDTLRTATRIGDSLVDLLALHDQGVFDDLLAKFDADNPVLEELLARGVEGDLRYLCELTPPERRALRHALFALLSNDPAHATPTLRDDADLRARALVPVADARFDLPHAIGDYTDFYASIHHATTVGTMFRPDNPLLPNYTHVPIGYHGRASSIVPSGTPITRPNGQTKADDAPAPVFGPSKLLDFELEVGAFIAQENELGRPIPIATARDHIFGFVLVNDWSARDLQKWEYQPLGPFLAKNFATSISPYIITTEALEPFRIAPEPRDPIHPQPLPYLADPADQALGAFDITLDVLLDTKAMRDQGLPPHTIARSNLKHLFWTFAQLLTHHASNGCNLKPGDLIASGTVSGPSPDSRGCLLELTWAGLDPTTNKPRPRAPIQLPSGETRTFLQDHDRVILRAHAARSQALPSARAIGFGDCEGLILPAHHA